MSTAALAAAGLAAVIALGACGNSSPWCAEQTRSTEAGYRIVRRADCARGLIFEIQSDTRELSGSALYVTLREDAPTRTREAVLRRPLVATCTVPGEDVGEFAGRWNRRFHQYGTALLVDDPDVVIADVATDCRLWVGRWGDTLDTASFPQQPFSRVRLR